MLVRRLRPILPEAANRRDFRGQRARESYLAKSRNAQCLNKFCTGFSIRFDHEIMTAVGRQCAQADGRILGVDLVHRIGSILEQPLILL